MAKFTDTPAWKKRPAYEQAVAKPKPKTTAIGVSCPRCRSLPGEPCTGRTGRTMPHLHRERDKQAQRRRTVEGRRAAAQERRWGGVTVRYECPICGGDHSRADHLSAAASVFDFGDNP